LVNLNSTLLWQVINFIILLVLLRHFLYRPVTNMLKSRAQKIEDDLSTAENEKEDAVKLREEYEEQLRNSRGRAQEIIEDAENRALRKAGEIIKEAEQKADLIMENKMKEIEQAKKEALEQLRNEVASISILAAGKLIQERLDQKKHQQLIKSYIAQLDRNKLGGLK
jgi:F-type H+-transporting ATPase subunit b